MGYMFDRELHVYCSDAASDFVGRLAETIVEAFKKEEKEKNNCFNTPGILNVAMTIQDGFQNKLFARDWSPVGKYLKEFIPRFEKWIKSKAELNWDDKENKQKHLKAYRKVLKNLEKISFPKE